MSSRAMAASAYFPSINLQRTNKNLKSDNISIASFWLGLVLILANGIMLFSYLSGVNNRSLQGYSIRKIQLKISNLNEENRKYNLQISEASAILKIQNDFTGSNFITVGTPKFVEVDGSQLTLNKAK